MASMSRRIAVPNSLLYIRDPSSKERPEVEGSAAVWSTASCVAISCLNDSDGETEITLGNTAEVQRASPPLFDRTLVTPSRTVIVEIVPGKTVCEMPVPTGHTPLRIWTDGFRDTATVVIGLG